MAFAPKPTAPEIASGNAFAASLRSFVPFGATAGPPREVVTNSLANLLVGNGSVSPRWQSWASQHPEYQAGVFPYSTSADGAFRFYGNHPVLYWAATSGYASGSAPTTRTLAVTFRVRGGVNGSDGTTGIAGMGTGWGDTAFILTPILATGTAGWKVQLTRGGSIDAPSSVLNVYADAWYTLAFGADDSGGAAAQKQCFRLYDWAAAKTYKYEATGLTRTYAYSGQATYLSANSTTLNSFAAGLDGWLYAISLHGSYFSDADFTAYIGDPFAVVRGTYTSNGSAVAAGSVGVWRRTTTTIDLGSTRPINGNGVVTAQWHRSAAGNFTPSGGTAIGGATTLQYTDTPPGGAIGPWFYRCVYTDGASNSATSNQAFGALDESAPLVMSLLGDSITDNSKDKFATRMNHKRRGAARVSNHGVQGATLATTWMPNSYWIVAYGTVTGGTFTLSWGGVQTSALAFNATSTTVQAALQAIVALGTNVTCGGALATGMTVSMARSSAPWGYAAGPLTIGNNSLTSTDVQSNFGVQVGSQLRQAVAKLLDNGGSLATVMLGANDSAAATSVANHQADLQNLASYVNAQGVKLIIHYPTYRSDIDANGALVITYAAAVDAVVAAIGDPTKCVRGDTRALLASARWLDPLAAPIANSQGELHPQIDTGQHWLEDYHADAVYSITNPAVATPGVSRRGIVTGGQI